MKLGWYVFMHRPDGGVIPIAGFWRKRTALRWAEENAAPDRHLEVQRFGWWSADAAGQRTAADHTSGCPRSDCR
ncbi:hypothetical protein A5731_23815 [Mycolicibacterium conceptionense]|jgi:hypothetical protein|uniref:Uncharacterized protein n=2 Tax=Mycolicibacterium TaxID=1866885 RepID=A0A0J8U372_9MYCO|nr:hypothetical protein AA982_26405 [Mycolicibacterium senegalense]KMV15632.1 hypothetical protein ACT17_24095 [Mycolicibacterium conceptionense]KLO51985.1 hypothetical protein ABW05_11090 [Mycolicibacterium senegalense]OBB09695.1 hypothetical protein A5718_09870 [Mycolicibacterium conceptionense]OBE96916.1 hypothetical protein A5731_23815 [Mycolicibacterium conceptionense]